MANRHRKSVMNGSYKMFRTKGWDNRLLFSTCTLPIINKAFKFQTTNSQRYICGNCSRPLWANRTKFDTVICPYCQTICTLPNAQEAFIRQIPGTVSYNCGNCSKVFYADRTKFENVKCPHCQTTCTLHIIKDASIRKVLGTVGYNCSNCSKVFYADRTRFDIVICPHCQIKCTLPNSREEGISAAQEEGISAYAVVGGITAVIIIIYIIDLLFRTLN